MEDRMARSNKTLKTALGLALLVVGGGLIYWGYDLSGSIGSQLTKTLSGSEPDKVMMFYIGGAVSLVVGLFLLFKK